jgi:hypothetical protein
MRNFALALAQQALECGDGRPAALVAHAQALVAQQAASRIGPGLRAVS